MHTVNKVKGVSLKIIRQMSILAQASSSKEWLPLQVSYQGRSLTINILRKLAYTSSIFICLIFVITTYSIMNQFFLDAQQSIIYNNYCIQS